MTGPATCESCRMDPCFCGKEWEPRSTDFLKHIRDMLTEMIIDRNVRELDNRKIILNAFGYKYDDLGNIIED